MKMSEVEKKIYPEKEIKLIQIFGKNVSKFRKMMKISQKELAFRCDVDTATISRIERSVNNTTITTISNIAAALAVCPSKLFEE